MKKIKDIILTGLQPFIIIIVLIITIIAMWLTQHNQPL
jgi:hypothetical protein